MGWDWLHIVLAVFSSWLVGGVMGLFFAAYCQSRHDEQRNAY